MGLLEGLVVKLVIAIARGSDLTAAFQARDWCIPQAIGSFFESMILVKSRGAMIAVMHFQR